MVDPLGCEVRAVEEGKRASLLADGSFSVSCGGSCATGRKSHRVTVEIVRKGPGSSWVMRLRCDCPSGTSRQGLPVACLHGATVGRRLERMGWATWERGWWYATPLALDQAGIPHLHSVPK